MARVVAVAENGPFNVASGCHKYIKIVDMGKNCIVNIPEAKVIMVEETAGTWCCHVNVTSRSVKNFILTLRYRPGEERITSTMSFTAKKTATFRE